MNGKRPLRRLGFRLGLVAAISLEVAALAPLAPGPLAAGRCAAAGAATSTSHAAIVIEHGDGSVVSRCVAFTGSSVTGKQLLDASAISWSGQTFGGFGMAVCSVDGEPAHYSSCPGADHYWAFFVSRAGGPWQLSAAGISAVTLSSGDAEGFRYVPTAGTPAAPPSASGVCAPAATPTTPATPTPATPAPTPRPTISTQRPPLPTTSTPSTGASLMATPVGTAGVATPSSIPSADTIAGITSPAPPSPAPTATATTAAGATATATAATATGGTAPGGSPSDVDLGLVLAGIGGGALAGLALLRILAARRPGSPGPPGPTKPRTP